MSCQFVTAGSYLLYHITTPRHWVPPLPIHLVLLLHARVKGKKDSVYSFFFTFLISLFKDLMLPRNKKTKTKIQAKTKHTHTHTHKKGSELSNTVFQASSIAFIQCSTDRKLYTLAKVNLSITVNDMQTTELELFFLFSLSVIKSVC